MNRQADVTLLRRFEPVIRFTRGEQFFPMDVEPYVRACSLWLQKPNEAAFQLVPSEKLTLDVLAKPYSDDFGAVRFLKIADPLSATELAAYKLRHSRLAGDGDDAFWRGQARLARVGFAARFIDALFSIGLLARGRVPGDAAAAAKISYDHIQAANEHYCYHGRVFRQEDWIVLQYWFFYPYNNWRSGFGGANDHEADWEMICVYLSETETGEATPEWVAYASHDYAGDDLRRRWDDPELETVGRHPVIYAGAGSHASYYTAGEYPTELELPFLRPLVKITDRLKKFWRDTLRQYGQEDESRPDQNHSSSIFRIPFVDYARGDGVTIGPGQDKEWDAPQLLNPTPGWAANYRGLWGLYARDPFSGEDAPAGPLYNRDGTMRQAWYDPVGWAGLDKTPPFCKTLETVQEQQAAIATEQAALQTVITQKRRRLRTLGVEAAAMRSQPHLAALYETHQQQISKLSQELNTLQAQFASDQAVLEALERYETQLQAGKREPSRAHIQRAHQPLLEKNLRMNHLAEIWAALSVGLMLILAVLLAWFNRNLTYWLMVILAVFISIESGFRRRFANLLTTVTVALAVVATLVIIYEFWWEIVVLAVLIAGLYILWDNLRELWR